VGRLTNLKPRCPVLENRIRPPPKVADSFYLTKEWRRARDLARELGGYQCSECRVTGVTLFVDHKVELQDGGAPYDQDNLRLLCGRCHTIKTVRIRSERNSGK